MSKIGEYFKRGFKYILFDYNQPIVKVDVYQKTPDDMFKDKKYVITGGGSGIGLQIAKDLVKNGAFVIITGRNKNKLIEATKELGENSSYRVLDMKNQNFFDDFFNELYLNYKIIDGIVNNAGISLHEWDFMKVDSDKFDEQFLTNLKGSYFFTQSYVRKYKEVKQNKGKILFVSSERGTYCDDLPYGLTKSSINSLVKSLSFEYYKNGLNINAIAPGVTATEMTGIKKDDDMFSIQNSQRNFLVEEVSEVALFLLSDYSICVSGEIIHTNAGNHNKRGY